MCVLMRNVWDPPEAATSYILLNARAAGADNGVTGLEVIAP